MEKFPTVTVVMPIRNEAAFIRRSLGSVLSQDYPTDCLEVIVSDGMSTDGTREIVAELAKTHSNVRMIDNPRRIAATGLNVALQEAAGEVILRIDGHCEIANDFLRRAVSHLALNEAECVGGPLQTIGESRVARSIAVAMGSRFGVGASHFRIGTSAPKYVDTVAFPAYKRETLQRVGDFDEELVRNQDDEYNYRLRKAGGRILLAPDLRCRYYSRAGFGSLWRQFFEYGFWKVRVLQKHPRQMQSRQFAPSALLLTLSLLVLTSSFSNIGLVAFVAVLLGYFFANLFASVSRARLDWRLLPLLPLAFGILHFSYGLGFLVGLIRFANRWRINRRITTPEPARDVARL